MTAAKRAAQFPDNMITQGNDMLCKWCWAVVKWEETLYAKSHLKSSKHKRAKEHACKIVKQTGASAALLTSAPKKQKLEEGPDVAALGEPAAATTMNLQQANLKALATCEECTIPTNWGLHLSKRPSSLIPRGCAPPPPPLTQVRAKGCAMPILSAWCQREQRCSQFQCCAPKQKMAGQYLPIFDMCFFPETPPIAISNTLASAFLPCQPCSLSLDFTLWSLHLVRHFCPSHPLMYPPSPSFMPHSYRLYPPCPSSLDELTIEGTL